MKPALLLALLFSSLGFAARFKEHPIRNLSLLLAPDFPARVKTEGPYDAKAPEDPQAIALLEKHAEAIKGCKEKKGTALSDCLLSAAHALSNAVWKKQTGTEGNADCSPAP